MDSIEPESFLPAACKRQLLEVPLETGEGAEIPLLRLVGSQPGPLLAVIAAQHGIELNGSVAACKVLAELQANELKGELLVIPLANPLAYAHRRHFLSQEAEEPYSGDNPHNMNRTWPGNRTGNSTERLTAALWEAGVKQADAVLDLHCWEALGCSAVLATPDQLEFARAFGLPRIEVGPRIDADEGRPESRMLLHTALNAGKSALTLELAGQYGVYPQSVREGVRGLRNSLAYLGMYLFELEAPANYYVSDSCERILVTAPIAGIFEPAIRAGVEVTAGELLGTVWSVLEGVRAELRAPQAGLVESLGPLRPHGDIRLTPHHAGLAEGEGVARLLVQT